MVTSLCNSRSE